MDNVVCSCLKCNTWIGKFENLWDRIGKTYYSPICTTKDLGGLVTVGDVREAAKTGVIENSFLQDLACKGCGEKLGLRCDNAPASHILIKDQLILRIGGMSIVSEESGEQTFLRVRRKFSLTGPQSPSVNKQDGREQPISLIGSGTEAESGPVSLESKMAPPRSDDNPLPGLMQFADWAEDAIVGQRKDIGRISTVISRIEKDMRTFKDFMIETRRDLATVPGGKPWASMKRTVNVLEEEVGSIRTELKSRTGAAFPGDDDGVRLSVEELDVLTSSIAKITQKVNEVESLKIELQFMKTRLKRFEDGARNVKQALEPTAKENLPAPVGDSSSDTPRISRGSKQLVERRTQETVPQRPPNPNSNARRSHGILRADSREWDFTKTPITATKPRKRKSDDFEADDALETMAPSAVNSQEKVKRAAPIADPNHNPYWKVNHKPRQSLLSNVQHIDEVPDHLDPGLFLSRQNFTEGNQSEDDSRNPYARIRERERAYDSAPESRPFRRKTQSVTTKNSRHRDSTTPEQETSPQSKGSRLQALKRTKGGPLRRGHIVGLRNEDGVRLTKKGVPDRRGGNYKYLKEYRERLKREKELGNVGGQEQENTEGGAEVPVMSSVEAAAAAVPAATTTTVTTSERAQEEDEGERLEIAKQAELEARDRLVRETLERELGV